MQNGVPLPGVPGGLSPASPSGDGTTAAARPAPPPNWPAPPALHGVALAGQRETTAAFPSGAAAVLPLPAIPSPPIVPSASVLAAPIPDAATTGAALPPSSGALPLAPGPLYTSPTVEVVPQRAPTVEVVPPHAPTSGEVVQPVALPQSEVAEVPRTRSRVPILLGILFVAIVAIGGAAFYLSRQGGGESQPEATSSAAPKKKGKRSKDSPKSPGSAAARPAAKATAADLDEPEEDAEAAPSSDPTAEATAAPRPGSSPTRPRIGPRPNGVRPPMRKIGTGE